MKIKNIDITVPNPAPYNPRLDLKPGDEAYEKLKRSLATFGYVEPIVVNKRNNHVIGGHQRLKVLKDLGHTSIQAVIVDLPDDQEKLLNIALNKVTGDWDTRKLAELLDELTKMPDLDVTVTGFDLPDVQELVASVLGDSSPGGEDDFDLQSELDTSRPAITQAGELLELGQHRLLCGDSTDPEQVRRLMDGKRAILFATDPPYLVGYDGTNHPGKAGERDKNKDWSASYGPTFSWDDPAANPELYEKFIAAAIAQAIDPHAAWYCWHASRRQSMVESAWDKHGAFVHQQIIWAKDRPILNRSWYTWQHEPCFFGWIKGNKPPRRCDDYPSTIWQVPTIGPGQNMEHPTSKPVELFAIPMRQHTRRGEICYEPFCGSGSQLIAAQKLGRRCFAIEISPHYCDVIARRWIAYMGADNVPAQLVERYPRKEVRP